TVARPYPGNQRAAFPVIRGGPVRRRVRPRFLESAPIRGTLPPGAGRHERPPDARRSHGPRAHSRDGCCAGNGVAPAPPRRGRAAGTDRRRFFRGAAVPTTAAL